jgi:hypothetical protein
MDTINSNTMSQEAMTENGDMEIDDNAYIDQLIQEKMKCVNEGRYIEAENIKRKIQEVKQNSEGKKKKDLNYQHAVELKQLEDSYNREMMEFHEFWEKRQKDFEEKVNKEEENLNQTHQRDLQNLYTEYDNLLPKIPKNTSEYIELKQIELGLVKQERFLEAHQVKIKAEAIAREAEEKFNRERNEKIKKKVDQLIKKQQGEKVALRIKINSESEFERKYKDAELEKLIHKFKNKKLELDLQQKQEKNLNDNSNMMRASNLFFIFNRNF